MAIIDDLVARLQALGFAPGEATNEGVATVVAEPGPTRTAIDARVTGVGDTRYAPLWSPDTAVTAGQKFTLPIGRIGTRKADGNTRATFDATEQSAWSFPRLVFSGTGVPTTDIPGAITGDRYVDTSTGVEYDIAVS